jgi:hypothetical protein
MVRKRQAALGAFIEGFGAKEVDYELIERQKKKAKYDFSSGSSYAPCVPHEVFPLDAKEYAFNDMVRYASDVVINRVAGVRVLVCPTCKSDLELVFPQFSNVYSKPDDAVIFHDGRVDRQCSLCECSKCNQRFFLPEVVSKGSFRLLMPDEDSSSYFNFLAEVFFKGHWMAMLGATLEDATSSPSGDTFLRVSHFFRAIVDRHDDLKGEGRFLIVPDYILF